MSFLSTVGHLCNELLNAAARVVSGTNKFDRGLSRLLHTELHWLDVPERVAYKPSVMMYSCMHGQAPQYLMDFTIRPPASHPGNNFDLPGDDSWSFHVAG